MSLWRRKQFGKLSCGFVNELGRFESDLQLDPVNKAESRFSKTLKKFVNFPEDKVKEDMAYKVAEMIIKDVTNVTLAEDNSCDTFQRVPIKIRKNSNRSSLYLEPSTSSDLTSNTYATTPRKVLTSTKSMPSLYPASISSSTFSLSSNAWEICNDLTNEFSLS